MKLTVLGAHAPYAPADKACNGLLLETEDHHIMLDCGHGAFAKLQKYLDFRSLQALVVSHYHPDHFHDYHAVRHAMAGALREGSRRRALTVFAPREGEPWQEMQAWEGIFDLQALEDYQEEPALWGGLALRFLRTRHAVPCYALSVQALGKKVIYTADTAWQDELVAWSACADLLVCEASAYNSEAREAEAKGHLTAGQAGKLGEQAGAKKLILTHLWPEKCPERLLAEVKEEYAGEALIAEEGLVLRL